MYFIRTFCFSLEAGLKEKHKVQVVSSSLAFGGLKLNERDRSLSAVTFSAAHALSEGSNRGGKDVEREQRLIDIQTDEGREKGASQRQSERV